MTAAPRGRFQFRLRTLMRVTALIAVCLALIVGRPKRVLPIASLFGSGGDEKAVLRATMPPHGECLVSMEANESAVIDGGYGEEYLKIVVKSAGGTLVAEHEF